MVRHRRSVVMLALSLVMVTASVARSQQSSSDSLPPRPPAPPRSRFTIGASVDDFGIPGSEGARITTISLRLSGFNHDGVGNELTLAAAPSALAAGGAFVLADMDLMQGVPVGDATVLARGGVSLVLGGGALPGVNLGVGLVVPVMPKLAVRLDAVYRPLLIAQSRVDTYSIGVGLMSLPALVAPAEEQ